MKIRDLIKKLQEANQDAEAYAINCDDQFERIEFLNKVDGKTLSGDFPDRIVAVSSDFYKEYQ